MSRMIIPQTAEQARQRDALHDRDTPIVESPQAEAIRLRTAIREHQEQVEQVGGLGKASEFSAAQRRIMKAKHDADAKLWAHLQPSGPDEPSEEPK